jgi:hypothetical protein
MNGRVLLLPFVVAACGAPSAPPVDAGAPVTAGGQAAPFDAGGEVDAGAFDAGAFDAGQLDAGVVDAGCGTDFSSRLQCLPGLTVTRLSSSGGFARYALELTQPVDHSRPDAGTFQQRATLSVSNPTSRPMVLVTSGYFLIDRQHELSRVYGANQLTYEYRYFGTSKPASIDWSTNTLRQAAADAHHFVELLEPLFPVKWVGAGLSKGGVTALAHRQHYPADVDATVAYGAPFSTSRADPRASVFLGNSIGGPAWANCRTALAAFQQEALQRKAEVLPLISGTFTRLPLAVAYEHAVVDFGFSFWMFTSPADPMWGCAAIPPAGAPAARIHAFIQQHSGWDSFSDMALAVFEPYYASTAMELGGPAAFDQHLMTLLTPGQYQAGSAAYLPQGVPVGTFAYRPEVQQALSAFVETQLTHGIFVNGEFDPWSAQAYTAIHTGGGNLSLTALGSQHTAVITDVTSAARMPAWLALDQWLEATAVAPRSLVAVEDAWHVISDEERRFGHRLR